jgi:NAD(P)-dependent dehydrogenase (short-subunit alcohol dehydrogenase family)
MKIILIGGSGLIGSAVKKELSQRHEIIVAGRNSGDLRVDIQDVHSIENLFKQVGKFDSLISTAGEVKFAPLDQLTEENFRFGINSKLMGQVNLVTIGTRFIADRGVFTLTSGILNCDPIRTGASAAMVNGALEGFVRSAAIELPRGLRINLISPTVILEAMKDYAPYFRGFVPVPAAQAALAYSKSVEGLQTGQVYRVGYSF